MQTQIFRRGFGALVVLLAACTPAENQNPYSKLSNPPLVQARLHTMTVLATADGLGDQLVTRGYVPTAFTSNYPASVRVEAALWHVPEESVAEVKHYVASSGPSIRLLVGLLPAESAGVDAAVERDFYRNVLGVDVPRWPAHVPKPENVHVQVWTYFVPSIVAARARFREQGIPIDFAPVKITTAYLGDHNAMSIRAPDGSVVELVESAAR